MSHVRYIDRTREYYLSQGYDKPYRWAQNDAAPFAPLSKPLSECRVAIVSTSDVKVREDENTPEHESVNLFGVGNVYSLPSDIPIERLHSKQEHFDKNATTLDDVNAYYPIEILHQLADSGRIGSVASRCHGVYTAYSQRKTNEADAPEVLRRLREDDVDVVLLTPV